MLLVKTKIGKSGIHGIGLFADQFIPKGSIVWKFQPGFDLKISENCLDKLSEFSREQFLNYAYLNKKTGNYVLCFDDARFYNHSKNPNCVSYYPDLEDEEGIDIAVIDINKGDEITCDYEEFDFNFLQKIDTGY